MVEIDSRRVDVQSFYLTRTEVTNSQYAQYLRDPRPSGKTEAEVPTAWYTEACRYPDQPVAGLSWDDAENYCAWAHLELPTHEQWVHAANGGTKAEDWLGDRFAWFGGDIRLWPHSVAKKDPNPFGLHDMYGSVSEFLDGESAGHIGGHWESGAQYSTKRLEADEAGEEGEGFRCAAVSLP